MLSEEFIVSLLNQTDAESLSEMMVNNQEKFKRYFPITISKNKSVEDSLKFIDRKSNV